MASMMQMNSGELRALRVWAVETSLGASALLIQANTGQGTIRLDIEDVLVSAGKLVDFVREDR